MSFFIKLSDQSAPHDRMIDNEQGYMAEVVINDFYEDEIVLTNYWSREEYLKQWIGAANRIIDSEGDIKSAFATAVHNPLNPQHGYVIQWWTAYKIGENVYIRNEAVPFDESAEPIDLKRLYEYIPDRLAKDEVSEWKVSVADILEFSNYLNKFSKFDAGVR